MEQTGQRVNQVIVILTSVIMPDQAGIQFDELERELEQTVEIGVACTEIVQIKTITVLRQFFHGCFGLYEIVQDCPFCEFQADPVMVNVVPVHNAVETGVEAAVEKLCHRQIDGNADRTGFRVPG